HPMGCHARRRVSGELLTRPALHSRTYSAAHLNRISAHFMRLAAQLIRLAAHLKCAAKRVCHFTILYVARISCRETIVYRGYTIQCSARYARTMLWRCFASPTAGDRSHLTIAGLIDAIEPVKQCFIRIVLIPDRLSL